MNRSLDRDGPDSPGFRVRSSRTAHVVRLAFGGLVLVALLLHVDSASLVRVLSEAWLPAIAAGFVSFALLLCLQGLRLKFLVANKLDFSRALRITTVSYFFTQFLPGTVGGDAYRAIAIRDDDRGFSKALPIVLFDRLVRVVFVVSGGLAFLLSETRILGELGLADDRSIVESALVISLLAAIGLLPWIWRLLGTDSGVSVRRTAARIIGVSALEYLVRVGRIVLFAVALSAPLNVFDCAFVLAAGVLLGLLPVSVGGLGIQEGAIAFAAGLAGASPEAAMGIALLNRVTVWVYAGLGGIWWVRSPERSGALADSDDARTKPKAVS